MNNEQLIYDKIKVILDKMNQKKQLQELARTNGLPINELELNSDTEDMVVLSVIALMIAMLEGDVRYKKLCMLGMQKRSLKAEIINDYKQRANMIYNKYKNGDVVSNDDNDNDDMIDDVPYDESFVNHTDE